MLILTASIRFASCLIDGLKLHVCDIPFCPYLHPNILLTTNYFKKAVFYFSFKTLWFVRTSSKLFFHNRDQNLRFILRGSCEEDFRFFSIFARLIIFFSCCINLLFINEIHWRIFYLFFGLLKVTVLTFCGRPLLLLAVQKCFTGPLCFSVVKTALVVTG